MELGLPEKGRFLGRVWRRGTGPALVGRRGDRLVEVISAEVPTMRDLLELDDPSAWLDAQAGRDRGPLADFELAGASGDAARLLSPADLQAIKASGVTLAA